ncbi:alkaline phosphatase synthesis sensor protein PhoR [bacterium BMS3Abin03]|nr:alkaline phosphatase synthesis sensor protein PhoR [bacterium BMS3Abin03]HDZ59132.1 two-component sensor histidine kinase [Ignavibacteriales bacterium]
MFSKIKSNLSSAQVYLKESLLAAILSAIAVLLVVKDFSSAVLLLIIIFVIGFIFLNLIGRKRNNEMDEIKTIINNIRKQLYNDYDKIVLNKNLSSLETAIKKMFQKSKSDIEHMRKLQLMRSQFIANVSHELRTPIFTIQGYIETLLDGAVNDPAVNIRFLSKAKQHTINLSNLLNDLIDISMIESGEMRMSYRFFKVNDYLFSITNQFLPMAEEKGIELVYLPVNDSVEVFGDREKLKQVFVNLIQNALKYTDKGKIEVFAEEKKKSVKFIVRDTGIGIPAEYIKRIFERFYRADKNRSRSVGGTGLGLAIAKHIIEAHGSQIEVKSEVEKGSEFSFELKK